MIEWLKCLFGSHDWRRSEEKIWGETVRIRQCGRCPKRQRWVPFWFHSNQRGGSWTNL